MENKVLQLCETCGGTLNFSADGKKAVCPFCGNEYFFKEEKSEALTLALNRANALRLRNDFDGAIAEYRLVAERNPDDAEAFWGLAVSTYGIEYVEDPRTSKRVPTCRRTIQKSILDDENYKKALENAPEEQREIYQKRATVIDRLQRNIKRQLEDEEDFDVFISFKSTDDNGNPTKERAIARHIYDELKRRGIKTFFSEVTLRDRIGEDFEPIIFKALYSAKFFILVATDEENINSAWVKNEWSRFRDRVFDENLSGAACAVFEGISPNVLPAFLRTQGINLAKYPAGGYEIELADALCLKFGLTQKNDEAEEIRRQIEEQKKAQQALMEEQKKSREALEEKLKVLNNTVTSTASVPTTNGNGGATAQSLLERGNIELANGDFAKATEYFNRVLDIAPKYAEAWWGLFLCDFQVTQAKTLLKTEKLVTIEDSIRNNKNYISANKFATTTFNETLKQFVGKLDELTSSQNYSAYGYKALEKGDFATAKLAFDAALKSQNDCAEAWLGELYVFYKCTSSEMLLNKIKNANNRNTESYGILFELPKNRNFVKAQDGASGDCKTIVDQLSQEINDKIVELSKNINTQAKTFYEQAIDNNKKNDYAYFSLFLTNKGCNSKREYIAKIEKANVGNGEKFDSSLFCYDPNYAYLQRKGANIEDDQLRADIEEMQKVVKTQVDKIKNELIQLQSQYSEDVQKYQQACQNSKYNGKEKLPAAPQFLKKATFLIGWMALAAGITLIVLKCLCAFGTLEILYTYTGLSFLIDIVLCFFGLICLIRCHFYKKKEAEISAYNANQKMLNESIKNLRNVEKLLDEKWNY